MTLRIALVVGKSDFPGGVEDYCEHLANALVARGHLTQVVEVRWDESSWYSSTLKARNTLKAFRPDWVIVQFTHLMWSARGYSLFLPGFLKMISLYNVKMAAVIHDPFPFGGIRMRDAIRRRFQVKMMRFLTAHTTNVFVTIWPSVIPWYHANLKNLSFLPIGSNIPPIQRTGREARVFTLATFGVGGRGLTEIQELAAIAEYAALQVGRVRLCLVGRGSREAKSLIESLVQSSHVEVSASGLVSRSEVSELLTSADVLVFVRGEISSRRGTVLAGIAHELPVVGYSGKETAWPIEEAGVVLVPFGNYLEVAKEVVRLAFDHLESARLREQNRIAYSMYFKWDRIAHLLEERLMDLPKSGLPKFGPFPQRILGAASSSILIRAIRPRSGGTEKAVQTRPPKLGPLKSIIRKMLPPERRMWLEIKDGLNKGLYMRLHPLTARPFIAGAIEPEVASAMTSLLPEGGVFWDLGANVGYFTLLAARLVGESGKVVSIEADPGVAASLRENVARNGFKSVEVINSAVWSETGIVGFKPSSRSESPEAGLGSVVTSQAPQGEIRIPAVSLDDLKASRCHPDVLKCDVEGAEIEVLKGGLGLLQNQGPAVIIEIHEGVSEGHVREVFLAAGYTVQAISALHLLAKPIEESDRK